MRDEKGYLDLLSEIMKYGINSKNRTGINTRKIFGAQLRFNLRDGSFPLLTTKKVFHKGIFHELLWIIKGDTNIKYLTDNNVHVWDEWADLNGDLGPVYGKQWRDFNGVDQLKNLIKDLKNTPDSRRLIVSAWNPVDVPNMALPPCHCFFQFAVLGHELHCQLYQRSADMFLGVPFNIASYALLTNLVAQVAGLEPGEFIHTFGDAHIYENHFDQVEEQLSRSIKTPPKLVINKTIRDIEMFKFEDFRIDNYNPHPAIKGEVAV